ncbi:protein of unknown function [Bradyrhizobium vignae]|uniref:histidine kinase n=1 Tax=Bradyrhizobium vignae TaxID=1549949 RepID=A0A2U3Q602_9BRAD|nr:protein of unknown function [Bradyrhizobium vignae]
MSKLTLPVRLALLVAGTMLPLIVFAVGLAYSNYRQDRSEATRRVLETVRSMRIALDSEVQRITGGLQVLALSESLQVGDFDGFRRLAVGFISQYGGDSVLLLADRSGRQLFSTVTTETANLPLRNNREIVERVFASKAPQYSDLPDRLQRRKRLQQPDAHIGDSAGEKADAGDHHQDAHGALDVDEVPLHAREQRGELFDHQRGDQKGNAEARGVDREQAGALRHRGFRRGDREDRGEDRTDARRPAEGESEAHDIGAPEADGLGDRQPSLAHQKADARQAQEVQAHDDDDDAGEDRQLRRPGTDQPADQRGAGAERHEHRGKAEHEQERRHHDRALGGSGRLVALDMLDRGAREVDQIGRNQRQDARREEADEAGNQRRRDRNILHDAVGAISGAGTARKGCARPGAEPALV